MRAELTLCPTCQHAAGGHNPECGRARPAQGFASNSEARKRIRDAAFAPVAVRGEAVDAAVDELLADHPIRVTVDHATREERYAAVLRSHAWRYGAYGLECTCGDELTSPHKSSRPTIEDHTAHVAAALVAADPAPAQPDAALSDEEVQAALREAETLCHERHPDRWTTVTEQRTTCLSCKEAAVLAARATQPVPPPEVSGGVAEVCPVKRDEFSAERRAQIIEALSWWEDNEGRWGHEKAANTLHAHEVEWCGRVDGRDVFDALPAQDGA